MAFQVPRGGPGSLGHPGPPLGCAPAYNLKLPPTTYHRQGGSGKFYYFCSLSLWSPILLSSSPVELPDTMLNMKLCIEWCRIQGLETLKFWASGFPGFPPYPNFKVLGFQGLAAYQNIEFLGFQGFVTYHNFELLGFQSPTIKRTYKIQDPSRSQTLDSANPSLGSFWDLSTGH